MTTIIIDRDNFNGSPIQLNGQTIYLPLNTPFEASADLLELLNNSSPPIPYVGVQSFDAALDAGLSARAYPLVAAMVATGPRASATRNGALGGPVTVNKTDGTTITATYRNWIPLGSNPIMDIISELANWSMSAAGEVVGDNAITVKAALEVNGVTYPIFSRGQRTITMDPGGQISLDPLAISLEGATEAWLRVYVTTNGTASGTWPVGRLTDFTTGRDSNNYGAGGADVVDSTGPIAGGTGTSMFGPISITGRQPVNAARVPCVGILGDSIPAGAGCTAAWPGALGNNGFIERALGTRATWITATRAGYRAAYVGRGARVLGLFKAGVVSTVIDELGVNDAAAGLTLAQMQANALLIWTILARRGIRVLKTTITPTTLTSPTSAFTATADQIISNPTAQVVVANFNDWLRALAPIVNGVPVAIGTVGALLAGQVGHPLYGYLEIADILENVRNGGKFNIAHPSARIISSCSITSGTTTLTRATTNFTQADVGAPVYVNGAGVGGVALQAKILSVESGTSCTLSVPASTTASSQTVRLGSLTADGIHPLDFAQERMGAPIIAALDSGQIV